MITIPRVFIVKFIKFSEGKRSPKRIKLNMKISWHAFFKMQYHHMVLLAIKTVLWLFTPLFDRMPGARIPEGEKWQIIGLHRAGLSFKEIARRTGRHYTTISRLVRKHAQTDDVKNRRPSGRPRKTTVREDRALVRLVRRYPFESSSTLKHRWLPGRRICHQTVRNRLKAAGLKSRRVIKRPLLTDNHKRLRLAWCRQRERWNLRSWRRIHWSDESRFLLRHVDGRVKVWRHPATAYTPRNIMPTVPYGGGSVMVWGCFSYDCKLDLVTIQGTLNGDRYIQEVLNPVVVTHFDNHPLATRPIFMDDNARPHRSRAVAQVIQNNALRHIPWPAMSPDLNPLEHIWDILGRRIKKRDLPPQNLRELEAALHEEWQQLPMEQYQRLVRGMRRRLSSMCWVEVPDIECFGHLTPLVSHSNNWPFFSRH